MPVQRAALSGMKYPTRESPGRDAASPISTTNLVAITVAPSTGRQWKKMLGSVWTAIAHCHNGGSIYRL